jgi:hypothetical protein
MTYGRAVVLLVLVDGLGCSTEPTTPSPDLAVTDLAVTDLASNPFSNPDSCPGLLACGEKLTCGPCTMPNVSCYGFEWFINCECDGLWHLDSCVQTSVRYDCSGGPSCSCAWRCQNEVCGSCSPQSPQYNGDACQCASDNVVRGSLKCVENFGPEQIAKYVCTGCSDSPDLLGDVDGGAD